MIIGIIPARFASTRFPGKPLQLINGKPMIQRVYEQAKKARLLTDVIIATDDQRIYDFAASIGAKVMMTGAQHLTGTDRCSEVALANPATAYINIQGDEPFIQPEQIDLLADFFKNNSDTEAIATLIKATDSLKLVESPNAIKVVISKLNTALYFSRALVPYYRNTKLSPTYYKHIGMYGYTSAALARISKLEATALESAESLEQLRWLENGMTIHTIKTEFETISIDVPEDLQKIGAEMG